MHYEDTEANKYPRITDTTVIQDALTRVINSPEFKDSKRSKQLLKYIVEKYISGETEHINGTTIAQDVLGAGVDFDPSTNPIVRVQAGRLRKLLSEYYRRSGKDDEVLIFVAKGQYVPQFGKRQPPQPPTNKAPLISLRTLCYSIFALGIIILGILILPSVWYSSQKMPLVKQEVTISPQIQTYPSIVILPFQNLTEDPKYDVLKQGFQHQLGTDLSKFQVVRVIFSGETYEEILAATDPLADYVLEGTFLSVEIEVDLIIKLTNIKTRKTIAQHRIKEKSGSNSYFDALSNISSNLSMQYAGRTGVLANESLANLKKEMTLSDITPKNLKTFECLSLFHKFEADKTIDNFNQAAPCLQYQVSQGEADSSIYASLAWLTLHAAPETGLFNNMPNPEKYSLEKALELAEQAIAIDPSNSVAHNYEALIQWRLGHADAAIMSIRQSIQLNPADASSLSNLGQFLCYSGDWGNGLKAINEAIKLNPNAQYWYYIPLFARAVLDRDGKKAEQYVQKHFGVGGAGGNVFALIAASMNGDIKKIQALKPLVEQYALEHDGDPLFMIRRTLQSSMIIDAFEAELKSVGISLPTK